MQIVIDIPYELYNYINSESYDEHLDKRFDFQIRHSVQKGIPLPKGHGRLMILSEDAVKRDLTPLSFSCQNWISELALSDATVAIIEADKESE